MEKVYVRGVGVLPREIGDEQGTVEDKADGVVYPVLRRECRVSSFMSQHPDSSHACALKERKMSRQGAVRMEIWGPERGV